MSNNQAILDAVHQASLLCRKVQESLTNTSYKDGKEPVTIADYGSQAIICRTIAQHYPGDGVLAEESGEQFLELVAAPQKARICEFLSATLGESVTDSQVVEWLNHGTGRDADRTWIIDPIDGTVGFINNRHYTIAVGLLEGGKPVEGFMGTPAYEIGDEIGAIFYTENGAAYARPLMGQQARKINVSSRTGSDPARAVESFEPSHADHDVLQLIYEKSGFPEVNVERVDGQDKYAMVACGDAEFYVRLSPTRNYRHKVWDHAAGVALVEAAGGVVTDLDGSALDFSGGTYLNCKLGLLVASQQVQEQVLRALDEVLSEQD